jgi:Transposase IS4
LNRKGVSSAIKMCKLNKNETAAFRERKKSYNSQTLIHMWNDKRQVNMISTFCSAKMTLIQLRNGTTIEKPLSVDLNDRFMGGVDLHDQLNAYYSCGDRKSIKW